MGHGVRLTAMGDQPPTQWALRRVVVAITRITPIISGLIGLPNSLSSIYVLSTLRFA